MGRRSSRRGASGRRYNNFKQRRSSSFLTDFWRDFIAVFGLILTAAGLIYAIIQIRLTKSAAQAAAEAAEKNLAENQQDFQRYLASNANRFINEVKKHLQLEKWAEAGMRINDIADQGSGLISIDPKWQELVQELREWADTCSRLATGTLKRFPKSKWQPFVIRLQAKIDSAHSPFQ